MCLVGIEGTGSYGAGLARYITAAGIRLAGGGTVRTGRTSAGKASLTRWTRSALPGPRRSGRAGGAPKGRDGAVEAIRDPDGRPSAAPRENAPGPAARPGPWY